MRDPADPCFLYRLPAEISVKEAVARYGTDIRVEFVEPNYHRELNAVNDPSYPLQWSLNNTGQIVNGVRGPAGVDIRWPAAMDLFRGTAPVIVAVVDSGVALDHPDLTLSLNINTRELNGPLGVDDDRNGYVDDFAGYDFYSVDSLASDENGHGTLVASLIAAGQNNRIGGVGICPTARIMPLRAFDQFGRAGVPKFARVSDVVQAYEYARQNGARIVNCSFGGSSSSFTELLTLRGLSSAGVLVVAAAGNGGNDGRGDNNDLTPQYPASYDVENLIAVAAQDRSGSLAGFSNYGPTRVHLAAPGTQIFGADVNRRVIYSESFNSGAPGWTVNSAPGNLSPFPWRLASVSGNGFLADRLGGSLLYEPFTNTYAQSPLLNFIGVVGARLTFDAGYALTDDFC